MRLLAVVLALWSLGAAAYPLCDSLEKYQAFNRSMDPWWKVLEEKRYADADKQFNALIKDAADGKMTDQELSRWFEIFRKWNQAREPLHEDWIRQFPNSAAAYLAAAKYYEARGWNMRGSEYAAKTSSSQFQAMGLEFRKAYEYLGRAENLMARPTLAVSMRMWMQAANGDAHNRIEDLYRSALKTFPETLQVRLTWIRLSHPKWSGNPEKLKAAMADAKGLSKDDARYIAYAIDGELGSAYWYLERFDAAAEWYGKAIPLCPGFDGALVDALKMHQERKNYEAIIPLATLYIERYPRNNWGWSMRGWAHIERKEYDAAASDYKMGAQYNSSYAQEGLAWLTEWGYGGMKQDYRKAIELYEIAAANGSTTAGAKAERVRQGIGLKAPAASVK